MTNQILLVEGNNDKHIIYALCELHQVKKSFEVKLPKEMEGKANGKGILLELFAAQIKTDKEVIGVVIDADDNVQSSWDQIINRIAGVSQDNDLGYMFIESPQPNGTIWESPVSGSPKLGVWIMPNNSLPGMMEDFMRFLISEGDKLGEYADEVLNTLEKRRLNRYGAHRSKAFIHSWLAWQKTPGMPMGQAITANVLDAQSPIAVRFIGWLNQLFNPREREGL